MSNIVEHAKKELELLGEEQATVDGYIDMLHIFVNMGHSGGSASEFIPTLVKLLNQENLMPLTDDPDEWEYHGPDKGDIYQNKRNGKAMSEDGGKTYWLVPDSPTPGYRTYYNSDHYVEPEEPEKAVEEEPVAVPFDDEPVQDSEPAVVEPVPEQGPEDSQHD